MEFIENIEREEYTKFVINHINSHFLKSYEWGVVSRKRGLTPHYVGLKDKNKLVATALLLEKKLPLGYKYYYIPRGYTIDYTNKDLLNKLTKEIAVYSKRNKAIFFRIDPDIKLHTIDENANVIEGENNYELVNTLKELGFKHKKLNLYFENMQPRFTFRIDLSPSVETLRKNYSKSVNRWIKIADKYGVTTKIGNKDELPEFVRLMKMTEKRQGFFSHEYSFYESMYDEFKKIDSVSLLLAKVDIDNILTVITKEIENCDNEGKKEKLLLQKEHFEALKKNPHHDTVSSYINVHYGNKSWYLYGANDMDYKDTYANYKLFDFQIMHAKELNKDIFDEFGTVGNPKTKKSIAGLHEFKRKFGGEYTEFIGEFTYIVNPVMYFLFEKLVVFYRKPLKLLRHIKVKIQKNN